MTTTVTPTRVFQSTFSAIGAFRLPAYSGIRVLLMPFVFGDNRTIPNFLQGYSRLLTFAAARFPQHRGHVTYLTVDEKAVKEGAAHRRPGLHVDGWPKTEESEINGGSWGGGGGTWGGVADDGQGTGLLTISSVSGCRAWSGEYSEEPNPEGDCEHLRYLFPDDTGHVLEPHVLYWLSPLCVHESLPMQEDCLRQLARISLPSMGDWYEGCTPNPLGVMPSGRIRPRRRFLGMQNNASRL